MSKRSGRFFRVLPARCLGLLPVVAAVPILVLVRCEGEAGRSMARPTDLPQRAIREVEWEVAFDLRSSLQDTTLFESGRIAADSAGLFVLDPARGAVLRFARTGALEWTFGRRGQGPDEFVRAIDLQVDARGRTWIVDDRNMRITVLDPAGGISFRIPLRELGLAPNGLAPLPNDEVVVATLDPAFPLVILDREGAVVDRLGFPVGALTRLDPLAAQFVLAPDPTGLRFVAAFTLQDAFFGYHSGSRPARAESGWLTYRGWYAEGVPLPEVERSGTRSITRARRETSIASSVPTAISVAVSHEHVYVLFGGGTEDRGKLLDIHSLESGAYIESLRLPYRGYDIAWGDGILYVAYATPYPSVVGLRASGIGLP